MWRVASASRGTVAIPNTTTKSPTTTACSSQQHPTREEGEHLYTAVCLLLFGDMLLVVDSETEGRPGMLVRHAPLLINDLVETDLKHG